MILRVGLILLSPPPRGGVLSKCQEPWALFFIVFLDRTLQMVVSPPPKSVSLLVWPCLFILGEQGSPSLAPHMLRTCQLEERLCERLRFPPQCVPRPALPSIPLIQFLPPSPVTSPWLHTKDTFSHLDFLFLDLRLPLDLLPSLALSASSWVSSHLPG